MLRASLGSSALPEGTEHLFNIRFAVIKENLLINIDRTSGKYCDSPFPQYQKIYQDDKLYGV